MLGQTFRDYAIMTITYGQSEMRETKASETISQERDGKETKQAI